MSLLAVDYDAVWYAEGSDVYRSWNASFMQHMGDLEQFVTSHLSGRGTARFVPDGIHDGSYNRVVRFSFASGGDVALKIPVPGKTDRDLAQEKIVNEAAWMQFFKEKTSIPVPEIYSCTTHTKNQLVSPLGLPYILMGWVPGESLRGFLAQEGSSKLRPSILQQMASIYLQLYHLSFPSIGSVAKDAMGEWAITQRPLTMDMHQFAIGIPQCPKDHWPNVPLENSSDYFAFVVQQHATQLWHLRNLNLEGLQEEETTQTQSNSHEQVAKRARRRYIARYGFSKLIPQFRDDKNNLGPFIPFCPDLDTRNLLVDPNTGIITGLIDVEFTNAMPAQFARDPPLWLFKMLPEQCLDRGFFPWFLQKYTPLLNEFLEAMRHVEKEAENKISSEATPLSSHMFESWASGRVWFNYAATFSDQVDSLYWELLYKHHSGGALLERTPDVETECEKYLHHTKDQIERYERAWDDYLYKTSG